MNKQDWTKCNLCNDDQAHLKDYYGRPLCEHCIKIEEKTDWDKWDKNRREKLIEKNEIETERKTL